MRIVLKLVPIGMGIQKQDAEWKYCHGPPSQRDEEKVQEGKTEKMQFFWEHWDMVKEHLMSSR